MEKVEYERHYVTDTCLHIIYAICCVCFLTFVVRTLIRLRANVTFCRSTLTWLRCSRLISQSSAQSVSSYERLVIRRLFNESRSQCK